MQGRGSGKVREFALFGETTGETDEFGLPARFDWASEYRGTASVVYGHTLVPEPEWLNRTINIDTGCVFGGRLTALRYPEMELVWKTCRTSSWRVHILATEDWRSHRQAALLAHGETGPHRRPGVGSAHRDPLPDRRRQRSGIRGVGHRVVGDPNGCRERGDGGQAFGLRRQGQARSSFQPAVKCRGVEYLRIIYGPD